MHNAERRMLESRTNHIEEVFAVGEGRGPDGRDEGLSSGVGQSGSMRVSWTARAPGLSIGYDRTSEGSTVLRAGKPLSLVTAAFPFCTGRFGGVSWRTNVCMFYWRRQLELSEMYPESHMAPFLAEGAASDWVGFSSVKTLVSVIRGMRKLVWGWMSSKPRASHSPSGSPENAWRRFREPSRVQVRHFPISHLSSLYKGR